MESRRFVGREAALTAAEQLLAADGELRILFVHGVGGIGKSALLREVRRRAEASGRTVLTLDGRGAPPALDLIAASLVPPARVVDPLILIDEADLLGANLVSLRALLVESLSGDARLVVAGRSRPDRVWWSDELANLTVEIALDPLSDDEARALLGRWGVDNSVRQQRVLDWAGGSPLALTIAATSGDFDDRGLSSPELGDRLIRHLAGNEIEGVDPAVLEVAALTWAVDERLIAAALPGRSTRHAMPELFALSVVERHGHRAVLHPLLARAVKERLRQDRPHYHRLLIRRIADNLRVRAVHGETSALFELTNLIEDPIVRSGAGLGASDTHYADGPRPSDDATIADALGPEHAQWWSSARRWLSAMPESACIVRRVDGQIAGFFLGAMATALPDLEPNDPMIAPILAHLTAQGHDPARALIAVAMGRFEPPGSVLAAEMLRIGNVRVLAQAGVPDLRYIYVNDDDGSAFVDFMTAMGYRSVESLRRVVAGRETITWFADFGPGGLLGLVHALVLDENGGAAVGDEPADPSSSLAALRDFGDDEAMAARGPIGLDPAEAAEVARQQVREAIDAAFDRSPEDRRLRRVLELAYLSPGLGEQAILQRLHLSRATYYRRLRAAREQFAGSALGHQD